MAVTPVAIQPHDPAAIRTYGLYWGDDLAAGDTLASCAWTLPAGLTLVNQGINAAQMSEGLRTYPIGTVAWVRVSGGADATNYDCTCHIVTAAGDEDDRTLRLACAER